MNQAKLPRIVLALLLVVTGVMVGSTLPTTNQARGQDQLTPEPDSFKTGGQLSVPILKDISTTLHKIDERMARLELVFQKLQATRASKTPTSGQ